MPADEVGSFGGRVAHLVDTRYTVCDPDARSDFSCSPLFWEEAGEATGEGCDEVFLLMTLHVTTHETFTCLTPH